jgi:lysozyme
MISGTDVSKWQGAITWSVTASRGIKRAYIRGSYGVTKDPYFAPNWSGAKDAGIERGVMLYPLYALDFGKQLDYWMTLPNVEHGEAMPCLDIEFNAGERKPDARYQVELLKLLYMVEQRFGRQPAIYTGPAVIKAYLKMPEFGQYPLLIANYEVRMPEIPLPWQPEMWYGWQHTSKGNGLYYGASSKSIDLDVFRW